jgi:hypothetical protein
LRFGVWADADLGLRNFSMAPCQKCRDFWRSVRDHSLDGTKAWPCGCSSLTNLNSQLSLTRQPFNDLTAATVRCYLTNNNHSRTKNNHSLSDRYFFHRNPALLSNNNNHSRTKNNHSLSSDRYFFH